MLTEIKTVTVRTESSKRVSKRWLDILLCLVVLGMVAAVFYKTLFLGVPISKVNMVAEWDAMFGSQRKGAFVMGLDSSGILLNIPYYFLISNILHSAQLPLWNPYA